MSTDVTAFYAGLNDVRSEVFALHPELPDHRDEFPWLTGCLGDPFSPVWFVAENPSITQLKRAVGTSAELQWSVSRGDRMLRDMLAGHGFKRGGPLEDGGWRCYITDVLKSAVRVKDWSGTSRQLRRRVAEAWAPVMRYELERGRPQFVVFLGANAEELMKYQASRRLIPAIPPHERIKHYTYIMSRPEGHLGPGHADRIAAWSDRFADIARRFPQHS